MNAALSYQLFNDRQWEVLHHIHHILEIPNIAQELLSAEKTPTLSMALPAYELLVVAWTDLAKEIPELSHYIKVGISKIMEYISKGRRSRIYALAMSTFTTVLVSGGAVDPPNDSSQPYNKNAVDRAALDS
jgi:hypothetical protein